MRTIAIPFVGSTASRDIPAGYRKRRPLLSALLAALDRLVPPPDPARDTELPLEWYRFPPF